MNTGKLYPVSAVDQLLEEMADERAAKWRIAHQEDPCSRCGTRNGVEIIPMGSLAKLTAICSECRSRMAIEQQCWQDGFYAGRDAAERECKARSWWRRLFR